MVPVTENEEHPVADLRQPWHMTPIEPSCTRGVMWGQVTVWQTRLCNLLIGFKQPSVRCSTSLVAVVLRYINIWPEHKYYVCMYRFLNATNVFWFLIPFLSAPPVSCFHSSLCHCILVFFHPSNSWSSSLPLSCWHPLQHWFLPSVVWHSLGEAAYYTKIYCQQ
jgi:hypothetical protein